MSDGLKGIGTLTESERNLVRQCLDAAVHGGFFPEWEFHTLFGLERAQAAAVLLRWPDINDQGEVDFLAVSNSLNNLLGYPHGLDAEWNRFIDASRAEVARVLAKVRGRLPGSYFDALE